MITICLPFYCNHSMLDIQLDNLASLPAELKKHYALIVVDDGSPVPAKIRDVGLHARLYRMGVDVPWNQDACRNLAAHHAERGWLLLTDMDHLPPHETLEAIVKMEKYTGMAYKFSRVTAPKMTPYHEHPNSWLMTKTVYEAAEGYDERYAGIYGTDGPFAHRVKAHASVIKLNEILIRYPREHVADASTSTLTRRSPENDELKKRVSKQIKDSGDLSPKRLTFPYRLVQKFNP